MSKYAMVGGRASTFGSPCWILALEEEMATHSSVLAWRIPGMGELGGLPSMGLHRVRHDWSDLAAAAESWSCQAAHSTRLSLPTPPPFFPSLHPHTPSHSPPISPLPQSRGENNALIITNLRVRHCLLWSPYTLAMKFRLSPNCLEIT